MISLLTTVLCGLLVCSTGKTTEGTQPSNVQGLGLSVRIVPASNGECVIRLGSKEPLRVMLKNVSATPLRLWKESNSWGYYALQFEMTTNKGERTIVRKKERGWRKNVPAFVVLESGKSTVLDVFLSGGTWEHVPANRSGEKVDVRVIFEVSKEAMASKLGVWTGRISSEVESCILRE